MHFINKSLVTVAIALTAITLLLPPLMKGSEQDLRTVFTINHPFIVPGMTLDANTKYVIVVGNAQTGMRQVVRIYNEDESKLLTSFLALWETQPEPAKDTKFNFVEVQEGYPQVVHSWFYPGRNSGMEFVYPKAQAEEIAAHAKQPILATAAAITTDSKDLEKIDVAAVEPGAGTTASATPPAAVEPQKSKDLAPSAPQEPAAIAQNEQPSAPRVDRPVEPTTPPVTQSAEPNRQPATSTEALPGTAGELPLIGLIGTLCLSLGLGIRLFTSH